MRKEVDETDNVYGRLTVLEEAGRTEDRCIKWRCLCECGNEIVVKGTRLRRGNTQSCGCLATEVLAKRNTTHGMFHSVEYKAWSAMKQRCNNQNAANYKDYGGRGINVCKEWVDSFEQFYADVGVRPEGMSIDRIDNDKDYNKDNCRWSTNEEQLNNKRSNRYLTHRGVTKTTAQWSRSLGGCSYLVLSRLSSGWSEEKAITTPARTYLKAA